MKRIHAVVAGVVAGVALAVSAVTYAEPPGSGKDGCEYGMGAGSGHGMGMGSGHGMGMGPEHGPMAGQQLMTPEERTALREMMHNAKTPEERREVFEAAHGEMEKRAAAKGITLPDHRGPGMGFGAGRAECAH